MTFKKNGGSTRVYSASSINQSTPIISNHYYLYILNRIVQYESDLTINKAPAFADACMTIVASACLLGNGKNLPFYIYNYI